MERLQVTYEVEEEEEELSPETAAFFDQDDA